MLNDSLYRPNVGIILINHRKRVLVGQRRNFEEAGWQMPQGGIDEGEEVITAGFRELEEEIGTRKARLICATPEWIYYDLPPFLQQKLWNGRYLGQKQKWLLLRFTGQDSDINLETAHPEFRTWRWVDPQALPELAVEFKRHVYQELLRIFAPYFK